MSDLVQDFILYGVQTTLAVSLLILLVLLIRRPVARLFGAQTAYMLWILPFARLLLPPLPQGFAPFAGLWPFQPTAQGFQAPLPAQPHLPTPQTMDAEASAPTELMPFNPVSVEMATAPDIAFASLLSWPLFFFALWGTGTALLLSATFIKQRHFAHILRHQTYPPTPLQAQLVHEIARQLRIARSVNVLQSHVIKGPMVTGMLRPLILLPAYFDEDYAPEEQHAAITHELAHVKRGDLWALLAARLFLAGQWFNPLAHYAMKSFRADQEAACDATILNSGRFQRHAYAATLVKAVKLASPQNNSVGPSLSPTLSPALPLAHAITERLSLMKNPPPTRTARLTGTALSLIIGTSLLIATSCTSTRADTVTISQHELSFDGKTLNDRRMVLLANPFEALEAEIEKLSNLELNIPEFAPPKFGAMPALPDMPEAPEPPEIREEQVEGGTKIIIPAQEIFIPDNTEEIEAYAAEAARQAEAYAEEYEQLAEEIEKQVEMQIDSIMTEEFDERIDEASDMISDLAERCREETFRNGSQIILEVRNGSSNAKAVCVKGAGDVLASTEVEAFIKNNDSLSEAEKDAFFDNRNDTYTFTHSDHD